MSFGTPFGFTPQPDAVKPKPKDIVPTAVSTDSAKVAEKPKAKRKVKE